MTEMTELTIKETEEQQNRNHETPFKKVDFKEVRDFAGLTSRETSSREWKVFLRKWYYKLISKLSHCERSRKMV